MSAADTEEPNYFADDSDGNFDEIAVGPVESADSGANSIVIDGFAIDSDEEEEKPEEISNGSTPQQNGDDGIFHPLQEPQASSPPKTTTVASSSAAQQVSATTTASSPTAAAAASVGATNSAVAITSSSMGGLLASMAQRVANAATTTSTNLNQQMNAMQVTTTTTPNAAMPKPSTSTQNFTVPATAPTGTLLTAPQQQQQQPHVEMDKEQKDALIVKHIGQLLPGERIIMFLTNLLHVGTASGFCYVASPPTTTTPNNYQWCCVMTFYRLILFSTADNTPTADMFLPPGWNAACWDPPLSTTFIEMPLCAMDRVEKTVYSVRPHHSFMGLSITSKMHQRIRFTTTSYADTQRAHQALHNYAFVGRRNLGYLFAFESKRQLVMDSIAMDPITGQKQVLLPLNPKRFHAIQEYQRQLNKSSTASCPWAIWSTVNAQYQICLNYPSVLVGPASLQLDAPTAAASAPPSSSAAPNKTNYNPEALRLVQQCAAFRSEARFPSLTWSSGVDGASLWRASQPKVGLQGNRNAADEIYLKHIMESAHSANAMNPQYQHQGFQMIINQPSILQHLTGDETTNASSSSTPKSTSSASSSKVGLSSYWHRDPKCGLKIMDLRPRSAAMANRTQGYGYELIQNYPGCTLQFANIANIHAVREAYQKLCNLLSNPAKPEVSWYKDVEDTKWLSLIRLIWTASWESAFFIHVHRMPVLVHCSHGWDRTSQVCALAQLLLDPYYRSQAGFACLIEKDFMSFGHPFHTRCAHGEGKSSSGSSGGVGSGGVVSGGTSFLKDDKRNSNASGGSNSNNTVADEGQISPIFIQFLDAVWQVVQLYPECFEFNTAYLKELASHVYSCRFGNVLCDSEREREMVAGIRQRTYSVWDHLESRPDLWKNPHYTEHSGVLLMPLSTLLRNVRVWTDQHASMNGVKPSRRKQPRNT